MDPAEVLSKIEVAMGADLEPGFRQIMEVAMAKPSLFVDGGCKKWEKEDEPGFVKWSIKRHDQYKKERTENFALKVPGTVPDPVVKLAVQVALGLPDEDVAGHEQAHRYFMQAENLVGSILERYIALELENHGWLHCAGKFILAIDFIRAGDPPRLLQVKNRDNSENSSSSRVRHGTTIEKWHRMGAMTGKTHWGTLPGHNGVLNEEGFRDYVLAMLNPTP